MRGKPSRYRYVQVTSLTTYPTFADAFKDDGIRLGAGFDCSQEEAERVMRTYYPEEEERKNGVLCIGVELY